MNSAYVRQAFRSSTASLSSRTIGRSSRDALSSHRRRIVLGTRQYSDDKAPATEQKTEADEVETDKTEVTPETELLKTIKAKEAETADLKSRLQYLQADFLNLQRNAAREKEQQRDFAITRFAGDLLETVDVLALALKSVPEDVLAQSDSPSPDSSSPNSKSVQTYLKELHQGVDMTHRLLLSTLFKYHVKPFDPTGDKFDPNQHEALYQAPIPGKEPGTILECQKTGYTIKDRLLRAAQVGVVQDTS
ncbi:GrpE-domain-containing protein [Suillus clintonianus]|uniref:GrpE-domain-containing protein n=1 Tax=Suillus clintonianus TaxID=1904413 RepID=UPI001B85BA44|nr:GrpE-domain-containing protein [Suillus clintonianus]KAG2157104.1 GrpE-domain-containing protein [Suillus clintonianus]